MRSIAARLLGRSRSGGMSRAAPRKRADTALLLGIGVRQASGFFIRRHGGGACVLGRRIFRYRFQRITEHGGIIGADRADIGAAPAAGDDAGAARSALPEIEAVLGA